MHLSRCSLALTTVAHSCAPLLQLFGGHDGRADLGDTYLLFPSATPQTSGDGAEAYSVVSVRMRPAETASVAVANPTARRFHTLVTDPLTGCVVMFGGCFSRSYKTMNDVWILRQLKDFPMHAAGLCALGSTHEWYQPRVTGRAPASRWGHSASMLRGCMAVFGGRRGRDCNDLHLLRLGERAVIQWQ